MSLNLLQKIILGIGAAFVAMFSLYVPWVYAFEGALQGDSPISVRFEHAADYSFIFDPPTAGPRPTMAALPSRFWVAKVDLPRVFLPVSAAVALTAVGLLLARRSPRSE